MKRIIFPIILVLILLSIGLYFCVFPAQKSMDPIADLHFYRNSGAIPPEYFYEENLEIIPDYNSEILDVKYSKIYPYRTPETEEGDISTSGIIGGEYFQEYDEILEILNELDIDKEANEEPLLGVSYLEITVKNEDNTVDTYQFIGGKDTNESDELEKFIDDFSDLFTANVY